MAEIKTDDEIRIVIIGDPHFKGDNQIETDLMETQLVEIINRLNPTFTVVLGDVLHTHEKIDLGAYVRATRFLRSLKKASKHLYLLIGNHEKFNNEDFLSTDHGFNALKDWGNTTVADEVIIHEHLGSDGKPYKFVFLPYVPPGRFAEALKTKDLEPPYKDISCIFAHQEFKGGQMGAIKSVNGDEWSPDHPWVISGHLHEFENLGTNIIYPGTPIAHTFGDKNFKSISYVTFGRGIKENFDGIQKAVLLKHEHICLDIPKRLNLKMNVEELLEYAKIQPDRRNKIKIKVKDEITKIKRALEMSEVKRLVEHGVIIVPIDTTIALMKMPQVTQDSIKTKVAFQNRLSSAIQKIDSVAVKEEFFEIFPNMRI